MENMRILVVDNDPLLADGVTAVLELNGYEVECCYGGRECVERVVEFRPDVIVSDHVMGDMTGLQVLRALNDRGVTNETLFVVITGYKTKSLEEAFEAAGAYAVISKSEASRQLLDVIDELHDRRAQANAPQAPT